MKFFKKNWKKILPLIGLFLLFYLLWRFDIKEIIRAFSQVNLWYLLLVPIILFFIFLIQTWKWRLILNVQNIYEISFLQLFKIQLIGLYYSLVTPAKVGGFLKAAYLKDKIGKSIEECSTSIFLDKILDLITLLIFSIIGTFFILGQFPSLLLEMTLILIVFCSLIFVFYSKERAKILLKHLFYIFIPKKFKDRFRNSFHLFYKDVPAPKKLLLPFLLTFLCWLLVFSQTFIIAKSLAIDINYFIFIFISALVVMVGLLPITISGLGTREAAFIILFQNFNITPQKLIAMSLFTTIITYILLFLIFLIFNVKLIKNFNFKNSKVIKFVTKV